MNLLWIVAIVVLFLFALFGCEFQPTDPPLPSVSDQQLPGPDTLDKAVEDQPVVEPPVVLDNAEHQPAMECPPETNDSFTVYEQQACDFIERNK